MAGGRLQFTTLFEGLREIKLRVALQRIGGDSALPTVHSFFGMAEALREETVIDESVGILRRTGEELAIQRIGIGIASRDDQAASVLLLQT